MNRETTPPLEFVPPRYQLRTKTWKQLEHMATRLFSEYIRRKDADPMGNVNCFTCHRIDHWTNMHCGHYASRKNMSTKFMEINNHVQCPICNITHDGNLSNYKKNLNKTYGAGTAEYIEELARKSYKYMRCDLIDLILDLEKKLGK